MVIVDSTVWINYFRNIDNAETLWLDRAMVWGRLGLTDMILCEVLQGIRNDTDFRLVRAKLTDLEVYDSGGLSLRLRRPRTTESCARMELRSGRRLIA